MTNSWHVIRRKKTEEFNYVLKPKIQKSKKIGYINNRITKKSKKERIEKLHRIFRIAVICMSFFFGVYGIDAGILHILRDPASPVRNGVNIHARHRLTTYNVILSNAPRPGKRALVIFHADSRFKAVSTDAVISTLASHFSAFPAAAPTPPDASCSGLSAKQTEIPSYAETRRLSVLLFSPYSLLSCPSPPRLLCPLSCPQLL